MTTANNKKQGNKTNKAEISKIEIVNSKVLIPILNF